MLRILKANRFRYLALICLMRKESIEKQGLVEFNVQVFQEALAKVLELRG